MLDGGRVLIVDDNADAGESLAALLGAYGATVLCAMNGEDALRIGSDLRPHVVFMDIGMPGLSGWETATRMRTVAWGRAARIIALSGWAQASDHQRSELAGFDHHHAKPIDPQVAVRLAVEESARDRSTARD